MGDTDDIKRQLLRRPKKEVLRNKDLLSTGSTLLNLALSGKARGGLYKNRYYFFVGDSASGKTFIALTCFAEASINSNFDGYRFIHDNAEDGALMDLTRFFGRKVNDRVEPPAGTREAPVYSSSPEEFYYHIDDAFDRKVPFIYVLDSMDSLEPSADRKKFDERKKAHRNGKADVSGSYYMDKAKLNSMGMRGVIARLKTSGSILIVISQTRDAVGFGFEDKTRSGGKALRFYAACEFWTSVVKTVRQKRKVAGKERTELLGIVCRAAVKKNRHTGRLVSVDIPILWSLGIDDTGGCVDYLVSEGHWKKKQGKIDAVELELNMRREELIMTIENQNAEPQLRAAVAETWERVKQEMTPERKNRYT